VAVRYQSIPHLFIFSLNKAIAVPIEAIMEIRTGSDARYYREQFKLPEEMEERWMTVVYILDGTYKTLHIVVDTQDVFQLWETSLRRIYVIRQGLMTGSASAKLRQTVWERQYWKGADEGGDQVLDFDDVQRLCWRLNANLTETELRELFQVQISYYLPVIFLTFFVKGCDSKKNGCLDFPDFQKFVKILQRRPDLEVIYERLSHGGKFDFAVFVKFMKESQRVRGAIYWLRLVNSFYSLCCRTMS
jgi:phosphatidylinositol phospholipase C, delta